jgi:hypothetical protein
MTARGVLPTYEAVTSCCRKFGQAYTNQRCYLGLKSVNLPCRSLIMLSSPYHGSLLGTPTCGPDVNVTESKVAGVILPSCFGGKIVSVPFCGILND